MRLDWPLQPILGQGLCHAEARGAHAGDRGPCQSKPDQGWRLDGDRSYAQNALTGALGRLLVTIERYPDLKSNQNFLALQSQLEGTENRISVARRDYIDKVQAYNTELKTFPGVLWASTLYRSYKPMETLTVAEDVKRVPQVKFWRSRTIRTAAYCRWCSIMLSRCQDFVARFVLGLVLVLVTGPAYTLTFPALTGRVVDEAGILDPATKAALEQKLSDFETKTTGQLVVVTLKSLQGTSIEDYGYQLGRHWQIGQKEKNTGALLIVAPNERKVRIEVGYGFEGTLTDAVSKVIIENSIIPRFRADDFAGGIGRGVDDII
jgi:hypothetical protein